MIDMLIDTIRCAFVEQILRDPVWGTVGFVGQFVFGARFILQWIMSEYKQMSYIPKSFWFISLAGSLILLTYAFHIKNPIFILGFSLNTLIYIRNLHLISKKHKAQEEQENTQSEKSDSIIES